MTFFYHYMTYTKLLTANSALREKVHWDESGHLLKSRKILFYTTCGAAAAEPCSSIIP